MNALKEVGMPPSITVVLSDRDGVEPKAPYLLLDVISTVNIGLATKSTSHKEGFQKEHLFQVKDFLFSLTFHSSATDIVQDWVQSFYTGLQSDYVDYAFSQQGLGVVNAQDIKYQPMTVDGKNYKRAILDITFRTEVSDSFNVGLLNKVPISGSVLGELDAPDIDFVVGD